MLCAEYNTLRTVFIFIMALFFGAAWRLSLSIHVLSQTLRARKRYAAMLSSVSLQGPAPRL